MPSFLIRGLARYAAASAMESRARRSTSFSTPPSSDDSQGDDGELSDFDLNAWDTQMRWIIPFVQATGNSIVIENPKSHEQIIINKDTQKLPQISVAWLRKYDETELLEWIAKEKERKLKEDEERLKRNEELRLAEANGRERFGSSFVLDKKKIDIADKNSKEKKSQEDNNLNVCLLFIYVVILVVIGVCIYYKSDDYKYYRINKEIEEFMNKTTESSSQVIDEEPYEEEPIISLTTYSSDSSSIIFHPHGCSNTITMIIVEGALFSMGYNDGYNTKTRTSG